ARTGQPAWKRAVQQGSGVMITFDGVVYCTVSLSDAGAPGNGLLHAIDAVSAKAAMDLPCLRTSHRPGGQRWGPLRGRCQRQHLRIAGLSGLQRELGLAKASVEAVSGEKFPVCPPFGDLPSGLDLTLATPTIDDLYVL